MQANIAWSIFIAFLGLIIAIIGMVGYQMYQNRNQPQPAWTYVLMIAGIVVLIVALILITYFFVKNQNA